ncbi:MAG: hypothetical protein R3C99_09625 [Pirellulaceae bacterium]
MRKDNYDSPWKEAWDAFFEPFLRICFPAIHEAIDWSAPPKMLDKELQQIAPVAGVGTRFVDKLVEVRLQSGQNEWILIHSEIQSQAVSGFAERMFVYFYRIKDKYNKPVVSLAVLGDDDPHWRPNSLRQDVLGCKVEFQFPVVKLLDFESRSSELDNSANPFATLILAHLGALRTRDQPLDRFDYKMQLFRRLHQSGKPSPQIRELFRLIDWMMSLPPDLDIRFAIEFEDFERKHGMTYVTSFERLGLEKGLVAGKIQMLQSMLGDSESSENELFEMTREQLERQLRELQQRLATRQQSEK